MAKKYIEPFSSPVDLSDMYYAYECCRKNKKNKYGTKKFEANALFNVQRLVEDINSKKYKLSQSQCFIVKDPKVREVFCAHFRDRVVQHFVFNELNPVIDKLLIFDAANCRVAKGTDFAVRRVERFVRSATKDYREQAFYLKMDLSGFFMRIQRQGLLDKVEAIIDESYQGKYSEVLHDLVRIILLTDVTKNAVRISPKSEWDLLPAKKTLFGNENGLPIGNICSQLFANLYLNDLDHMIKSRHRYYSRYVDDMIIVDENRD